MKKMLSILLVMVLLVSILAIPASAYTDNTSIYYPMQQETYGFLELVRTSVVGITHCELNRAGKIVKVKFKLIKPSGIYSYIRQNGGNYDTNSYNVTDNNSPNNALYAYGVGPNETFTYAETYHKVRISSYVHWDNAVCQGSNNGYDIPAINLD